MVQPECTSVPPATYVPTFVSDVGLRLRDVLWGIYHIYIHIYIYVAFGEHPAAGAFLFEF